MDETIALRGLEVAKRLAALSPETQAVMAEWSAGGFPPSLWINSAFRQIGRAIASKRTPVSQRDLKRLFVEIDRLLKSTDTHIANSVATNLLEEIWRAAHNGGFDFSIVDPHLGPEARSYLLSWDTFNRTKTLGLKAR